MVKKIILTFVALLFKLSYAYSNNYIKDGYTDKLSYNQGDTVILYINADTNRIVKMPLRTVDGDAVDTITATVGPQSIANPISYAKGFGYTPTTTYKVPLTLKSGIYNFENKIFFIVKEASATAGIVVLYPTNTEAAYGNAGGKSLYNFNSSGKIPSDSVSFLRPLDTMYAIQRVRFYCTAFLKWIRQQNFGSYKVRYISDVDMEDWNQLKNSKVLIVIGHSEYWSKSARLNLDKFVDSGRNAIILSGNTMYWQVRYNYNKTRMICYKTIADPIADPLLKTISWTDPSLQYQPMLSIGVDFLHGGYGVKVGGPGWHGYKIVDYKSPLLAGTGLQNGNVLSCPSYEFDGTLLKGFNSNYAPIIYSDSLKFCKIELLGYDFGECQYANCTSVCTFIVFRKSINSGIIINTACNQWCSTNAFWVPGDYGGMNGKDSLKIRKITSNMIVDLINDSNVFTSQAYTGSCIISGTNNLDFVSNTKYVVYPNPSSGKFYIANKLTNDAEKGIVYVYNIIGQLISSFPLRYNEVTELNMSKYPRGLYLYRIESDKNELLSAGKLILIR